MKLDDDDDVVVVVVVVVFDDRAPQVLSNLSGKCV